MTWAAYICFFLSTQITECFLKTVPSATCALRDIDRDRYSIQLKVYNEGTVFMKIAVVKQTNTFPLFNKYII